MTPEGMAELRRNLEAAEGRVGHMYLDTGTPPWVTCGVGHRIATVEEALALPFAPASAIERDFRRVSSAVRGFAASGYESLCETRLSPEAIDELLAADVAAKLAELERRWPAFAAWPEPAQRAVADMAFNLGLGGLERFMRLTSALERQDWATCAAECHRRGISEQRNAWTVARFQEAAG